MIPTLGIVGGIGSGKSLVANCMQKFGGHLINADLLGHEALVKPDIRASLVERWGRGILNAEGNPDRKNIGRIVFADPVELRALESLVFPYIEKRILDEIEHARTLPGVEFIILDAAIMIETGWHRHCDKIVFVEAARETRLKRLQEKRGWTEKELHRREQAQMPLEEKKRHADAVIVNDAEPDKVVSQVQDLLVLWKMIC
jgi:dephospho-CoA kinase